MSGMDDPSSDDELPFFKVGNVARGFIAVGNVAYGFVAIGFSVAVGPIAIGLNAVSPFLAIGLNSVGLISISAINAVGLLALAGVNVFGGFGGAAVNSGIHPIIGIVFGVVCLVGSRFFPKSATAVVRTPGVPDERVPLEDLTMGRAQSGWVEARLERAEAGAIHLRQRKVSAAIQASPDVMRYVEDGDHTWGARDGFFHVAAFEEVQSPRDPDYRHGPDRTRRLGCAQALFPKPLAPWWARTSVLNTTNRVCMVVSGVLSIAIGIAGLIL